jgi:hypothetical protein
VSGSPKGEGGEMKEGSGFEEEGEEEGSVEGSTGDGWGGEFVTRGRYWGLCGGRNGKRRE